MDSINDSSIASAKLGSLCVNDSVVTGIDTSSFLDAQSGADRRFSPMDSLEDTSFPSTLANFVTQEDGKQFLRRDAVASLELLSLDAESSEIANKLNELIAALQSVQS